MFKKGHYKIGMCLFVFCVAPPLHAAIQTIHFSGTLSSVYDKGNLFEHSFRKGEEFTGSCWMDTEKLKAVRNSLSKGNGNSYRQYQGKDDAFGITLSIGDRTFTSGKDFTTTVTRYSYGKNSTLSLTSMDTGNRNHREYFGLTVSSKNEALDWENNSLQIDNVDLSSPDITSSLYYVKQTKSGRSTSYGYVMGGLKTMYAGAQPTGSASATPEPTTLSLLGAGACMLLVRRKGRNAS